MIEDGLHRLITADAGFIAIAEDRLYPLILPEMAINSVLQPSASYQLITAVPDYTLDGPTGMVKARIQIDTWASTYAGSKALTEAIRLLLDGYAGVLPDGTAVQNIWRENVTDSFEPGSRLYRTLTDWRIIFAE